jgi:hypothetical protein
MPQHSPERLSLSGTPTPAAGVAGSSFPIMSPAAASVSSMSPRRGLAPPFLLSLADVSLAARTPARGLCVGHTADAERRDHHGDHDQFLYHFLAPQKIGLRPGMTGLYHRSHSETIAARANSEQDSTDVFMSTNPAGGSSNDDREFCEPRFGSMPFI